MNRRNNIANRQVSIRKSFYKKKPEGFTLIEVLIVIAVSAILSTIVITYSSTSKNKVSVSIESARISQTIFQAKTLAISTYTNSSSSCGYGVLFNYASNTYSIFTYAPISAPPCPTAASITNISSNEIKKYSNGTWNVPLLNGVSLQSNNDSIALVLFYPPDPATFISRNINPDSIGNRTFVDMTNPLSNVYIAPIGNASATQAISVNLAGQVTL